MKKNLLAIILLSVFSLYSCNKQKNEGPIKTQIEMSNLVVPAGFNWETARDINFKVGVTDARFNDAVHIISIYDADPLVGGTLLSRGAASMIAPFETRISLASTQKEVFVIKTSPDNSMVSQSVIADRPDLTLMLGAPATVTSLSNKKSVVQAVAEDCNTGCTQTITTSNTNLNVNDKEVICVTGSNITIGFNGNGGTVKICGSNVTVQNASLNNKATLIITKTGSATFSNLNINGSGASVYNYGKLTVSGSFSPGGVFVNQGELVTNGDFSINTNATFTNNGNIAVEGTMNVNTYNVSTNNGSIVTGKDFQLNKGSIFINNCSLLVKGNFNNTGVIQNYSLIKVVNQTTVNSASEIGLYNNAMLTTGSLMVNSFIKGYGTTSLVKVSGSTTINSTGGVTGDIQFCGPTAVKNAKEKFTGGAVEGCGVYIAVTACNAEGNGKAPVLDSDGDGVNDTLDEYPKDASKAFNNYYPSAKSDSRATVAFEDKWPLKGDYDMNDVVISYQYKVVTNSKNMVVQVVGNYSLLATGGAFENGFGVEFPVSSSLVSSIKGAELEKGQEKAVAILFTNTRNEMKHWNTEPGEPVSEINNYVVDLNLKDGPDLKSFGLSSYNPFIWNNGSGFGRGCEIHLPGKTPTQLANKAIFGTNDDYSKEGSFYMTEKGLPWAINIPTSSFAYPVEKTDITKAYLHLAEWVQSGGESMVDWYDNLSSGYRDDSQIYTK